MSKTWKERLIMILVEIALGILILIGSTQISFKYTRDYTKNNYFMDYDTVIKKLDYMISKIDTLNLK